VLQTTGHTNNDAVSDNKHKE